MLDSEFLPQNPDMDEEKDNLKNSGNSDAALDNLNAFGRNLSALAANGELDPVIGRHDEITGRLERTMKDLRYILQNRCQQGLRAPLPHLLHRYRLR